MTTFDIISDTHWDFWVNANSPEHTQKKIFSKIFSKIVPENHSKHLIIAGDIGHYNSQNKIVFKVLLEIYENVIFVTGNHDLYLLTKGIKHKYKFDSFNRIRELAEFSQNTPGLHFLDGNIVTIDGINIGGGCGWYDDNYATKEFNNYTKESLNDLWKASINDSENIITVGEFATFNRSLDWIKYAAAEKQKLLNIYDKCSIIVTHIPPIYNNEKDWPKDPISTFYQFDGSDILDKCAGKVWIYGHIHNNTDYVDKGCHFVTNALGYPVYGHFHICELDEFKIKTIEIN